MTNEVPEKSESIAGGFLAIIEKASQLDTIDVDKLAKMMEMQLQWEAHQDKKRFDEAKARISKKLANIKVVKTRSVAYDIDKNDKNKGQKEAFKYAALEDIEKLTRPFLDEEGMVASYDIEPCALAGWHTIVCWLSYQGHREAYRIPMPLDTSGGKGNAQAMGSTQTYGMRRAYCAAFNIITIGEDDDGSEQKQYISEELSKDIENRLDNCGADKINFCKLLKVSSLKEIKNKDYNNAISWLLKKEKGNKNGK